MYQARLNSFFQASLPSPPVQTEAGLLRLPPSVRNRVYEYAGPFGETIDLNFSNLLIYPYKHYPERLFSVRTHCAHVKGEILRGYDETAILGEEVYWEYTEEFSYGRGAAVIGTVRVCTKCFDGRSLLFVCRRISEEVLPFFYANNFFKVRQGAPYGLKRLRMMGPLGLQFLKSLTIILGTEDSLISPEELFTLPAALQNKHKPSRASLANYEAVVKRLAERITPNYCELYVVFRVGVSDLVEQVMLPLFQLPTLKNCGIWPFVGDEAPEPVNTLSYYRRNLYRAFQRPQLPLANTRKMELMLRSIICRLTFQPFAFGKCFRYLDLPAELRLRILCFSDLVVDDGVQWRPQGHPREAVRYGNIDCSCSFELLNELGGCVCYNSWWSVRILNAELGEVRMRDDCCRMCKPISAAGLCFCSRTSSHTFSSSCTCRPQRHSLFSVSRQVRKDAIETYYSLNRFYITPFYSPTFHEFTHTGSNDWPQQALQGLRNMELSLYLCSLPFNALQHIRWLEWLLPSPIDDYLHPRTHAWLDYLDALEMMRNSMDIKNLTFVLNMSGEGASFHAYYRNYHSDDWKKEWQIGLALRRLGQLKDCFVYLSRYNRDSRARERQEQLLEKAIMGKEYESTTRGKPLERVTAMSTPSQGHGFYEREW